MLAATGETKLILKISGNQSTNEEAFMASFLMPNSRALDEHQEDRLPRRRITTLREGEAIDLA